MDGRTCEGQENLVLDQIRAHGGFSAFWVSENKSRANAADRLQKSGRITTTPMQYPWVMAVINREAELLPGDYVLATKWSDGDPCDHWCVGFYHGHLDKGEQRFLVVDNEGQQFRRNGFRRIKKISGNRGAWLIANTKTIEQSCRSLWWWVRQPMAIADGGKSDLRSGESESDS